jgi:hypothetical protein
MSIFFRVLQKGEDNGLKCTICHKDGSRTQLQNMKLTFADGETCQGEVEVSVHFSCLVEASNNARAMHIRKMSGKSEPIGNIHIGPNVCATCLKLRKHCHCYEKASER